MSSHKQLRLPILACSTLALAACGGGGGGSGSTSSAPAALTISGTAATGNAIAGKTVQVKCASGTASATTGTDGSYSLNISGGVLPCVLEVAVDSSSTLHSAIESGATTLTANLTPLTEMLLASATGQNPASLFANFDAATQAKLTQSALTNGASTVTKLLAGAGAPISGDPMKTSFKAASGSAAGDSHDNELIALQSALQSAQLSLADVIAGLAAGGSTGALTSSLKPAASSCKYLHTGDFTTLDPYASGTFGKGHIDAGTLVATYSDGGSDHYVADTNSPCSFTSQNDGSKLYASRSGILVSIFPDGNGKTGIGIGIPTQDIPLSELQGDWNQFGFSSSNGQPPFSSWSAVFTLNAAGKSTAAMECTGTATCTAAPAILNLPAMTAHPDGGYTLPVNGITVRVIPHKTLDGKLHTFTSGTNGETLSIETKVSPLTLPSVSDAPNSFWRFWLNSSGKIASTTEDTSSIISVNSAAGSYVRALTASPGVLFTQLINNPRSGLRLQPTAATMTNGANTTVSEILLMPLSGTGINVFMNLSSTTTPFGISINKP